jgi:hypothetical protein
MARHKKKSIDHSEESEEKLDMSPAGSLRRIADSFRASAIWDPPTAADLLDKEADILDPPPPDDDDDETPTA